MKITGKVIQILPLQTGMGKNGEWKKQDIIIETEGQYPKKVCVSLWNDKIIGLNINNNVEIAFEVESREYNGKWYTDVKAWKIDLLGAIAKPKKEVPQPTPPVTKDVFNNDAGDDLPF